MQSKKSKSARIPEVDLLRGIAVIMMILGHSFITYPINILEVPWCTNIQHFIYTFHMELFFLLSGIVYHCSNYKDFLFKKFKRIFIPYIFFGLVTWLLKALGGSAVNRVTPLDQGLVKFLFYGGNYWFLYTLFLVFILYPWLERYLKKVWLRLCFAILLAIISETITLPDFLTLKSMVYYLPYFIIGHCLTNVIKTENLSTWKKAILSFGSLLVFIAADYNEKIYEIGFIGMRYLRAFAIIIVFYFIAQLFLKYSRINILTAKLLALIEECGKYSLQLYLFNGYLLTAIRIVICTILHIESPFIIVMAIWGGNLILTITACKWILPKIPVVRNLCGLS